MAEEEYSEDQESGDELPINKKNNTLPLWGNKETMNINSLILKNIKSSPYFKQDLYRLKTYHEVVDEIFYKVGHLEPWEKNSRKLASQIGHAGEVRGVSAGGIVSTPYCLLYKLFTLKLTRKQLKGLLDHADSPYLRGLGFMYIRYCQPPPDLIEWYEPYFWDDEVIDLKAGGGFQTTIGEMCKMLLTKLDWFGTLFPRIPVVVENQIREKMKQLKEEEAEYTGGEYGTENNDRKVSGDDPEERRQSRSPTHSRSKDRRDRSRSRDRKDHSRSRDRKDRSRSRDRRDRSRSRDRRDRSRSRDRRDRSRSRDRKDRRDRSRSRDRRDRRDGSRSRDRRDGSRSRDRRDRSRSRDRRDRSRSRDRKRSGRRSPDKGSKNGSSDRYVQRSSSRERSQYKSSRDRGYTESSRSSRY